MAPKLTNTEVLERLGDPRYQRHGFGLLITGGSGDERSKMANMVLRQRQAAGHSWLSLTPFHVAAGYHYGNSERLCHSDVLVLNELGALSRAEEAAIAVIDPSLPVTPILESILDRRQQGGVVTVVTTEHELSELAVQFSPRLASLLTGIGFSIRLDDEEEDLHADRF